MTPLQVVAVDDERLALRRIELLLARIPDAELVGTARDVEEALALIDTVRPDLLLLDVKLAGASGFDIVERLPSGTAPLIVFATAFDHFAAHAFDVNAVDYVVKPIDFDRLRIAIDKVRRSLIAADAESRLAEMRSVLAALRQHSRPDAERRYEREIWAERLGQFHPIRVNDIRWVEAERDYVRLHAGGHAFLLRETLSNMAERLNPDEFIRVRRSAVVRLDAVKSIRSAGYGDFRMQLVDGEEFRVGRTYVKAVRRIIAGRTTPN